MKDDKVWISICSAHTNRNYECSICKTGHWFFKKEIDEDQQLFINDYPEWYKKHNNGIEPDKNVLDIWNSIIEKEEQ